MIVETALECLFPSLWELKVTVFAAAFVISAYCFFTSGCGFSTGAGDRDVLECCIDLDTVSDDKDKIGYLKGDAQATSAYLIKMELLAAKNLIGANLNGTSDPYAIITCGAQKRFSSMVPGSRNPMWGEEFNFAVDELPVVVHPISSFPLLFSLKLHRILTTSATFNEDNDLTFKIACSTQE